jgi:hypothetical protein
MRPFNVLLLAVGFSAWPAAATGQVVNWRTLGPHEQHVASAYAGIDYGAVVGAGYAWHRGRVLAGVDASVPAGNTPTDDFRTTMGVNVRWLQHGALGVATEVRAILRRYENPYVRLLNAGSDISGTVGLFGHRWFLAGHGGFDKAIATRIENSDPLKISYPSIRDGWYRSTGGNVHFGLQGGRSIGNVDAHLELGRILEQDLRTTPTIPFYARLGITLKLGR